MRSRLPLYGALLVCLVLLVLAQRHFATRSHTTPVSQSLVADRTGPSGVTDLDSLRNRMTDPFRLRPDLRFMRALDLVDAMLGAPDSVAAGWAFSDGRWRITCDGRDVGTLSEMPDYAELDSLLLEWARVRLAERRNAVGASPARSAKADASLQKLDALWAVRDVDQHWRAGEHGVGLLGQAADGLTWLALETVDRVGAGDPVTARAFAAVALGRAAGLDLDRDRALLAKTMGYGAAAGRSPARCPRATRCDSSSRATAMACAPRPTLRRPRIATNISTSRTSG